MRKFVLLVLILLLVVVPVQAQDKNQLRQPELEEYLTVLPHVLETGKELVEAYDRQSFNQILSTTMMSELRWRYPDLAAANTDLLYKTFHYLTVEQDQTRWAERDVFVKALITAWLNESEVDLNTLSTLPIYEFEITVTSRDYNADGQAEWLLQITSEFYTQYLVATQNNRTYQIVESPLPWFGCCFGYWETASGFIEEQYFGDMTGDGTPEWVLALGGLGGNDQNHGWLYVLNWQDGELVDLAPQINNWGDREYAMAYSAPAGGGSAPLFPNGVEVTFEDINSNGTVEILIEQQQIDNWGCTWQYYRTFSFNGTQFELAGAHRVYDDVQGCEIRLAEEAMWAGNITLAIEHYENGFQLQPTGEYFFGDSVELSGYAQARLAIAYSLLEQDDLASKTVARLSTGDVYSPTLNDLIKEIAHNLGNPMEVCKAAYDVFSFDCELDTDTCLGSPLNAQVGRTIENSGYSINSPWNIFPSPARAGCDPAIPLQAQLSSTPLASNLSPTVHLTERGYTVLDAIHFDLNWDGHDEWLVWIDLPVPGIFFYPDGDHYNFRYTLLPYAQAIYNPNQIASTNPYYDTTFDSPEPLTAYDKAPDTVIYDAQTAFEENRFLEALDIVQAGLEYRDLSTNQRLALLYLRALAFEALGQNSDALASYETIRKSMPQSAWGLLAELHFDMASD